MDGHVAEQGTRIDLAVGMDTRIEDIDGWKDEWIADCVWVRHRL